MLVDILFIQDFLGKLLKDLLAFLSFLKLIVVINHPAGIKIGALTFLIVFVEKFQSVC
jgi:hypothetical protein